MSTVLVLTPVIVASWPAVSSAVIGAATALGFLIKNEVTNTVEQEQLLEQAEVELAKSSVVGQSMGMMQEIQLSKGDIEVTVRRDERGRCVVCAKGKGYTKEQLQETAEEFSGKLTQIYTYNKVMAELRNKGMKIVNEEVMKDNSIRINVRQDI